MATFQIPNTQKTAKLVLRGLFYALLIFHLWMVYVYVLNVGITGAQYGFMLIVFLCLGLIPCAIIFAVCEAIFLRWKKHWSIVRFALSKIIFSTLIIGAVVGLVLFITTFFYDQPHYKLWKSMLFDEGIYIYIIYAPVVFLIDYLACIVFPKLKATNN